VDLRVVHGGVQERLLCQVEIEVGVREGTIVVGVREVDPSVASGRDVPLGCLLSAREGDGVERVAVVLVSREEECQVADRRSAQSNRSGTASPARTHLFPVFGAVVLTPWYVVEFNCSSEERYGRPESGPVMMF
jgi:hypothetical protein